MQYGQYCMVSYDGGSINGPHCMAFNFNNYDYYRIETAYSIQHDTRPCSIVPCIRE